MHRLLTPNPVKQAHTKPCSLVVGQNPTLRIRCPLTHRTLHHLAKAVNQTCPNASPAHTTPKQASTHRTLQKQSVMCADHCQRARWTGVQIRCATGGVIHPQVRRQPVSRAPQALPHDEQELGEVHAVARLDAHLQQVWSLCCRCSRCCCLTSGLLSALLLFTSLLCHLWLYCASCAKSLCQKVEKLMHVQCTLLHECVTLQAYVWKHGAFTRSCMETRSLWTHL